MPFVRRYRRGLPGLLDRAVYQVRTYPSGLLLTVQLLGVVIYPFTEPTSAGRVGFSLFQLIVLAFAVLVVARTPAVTWVFYWLGPPTVILTVLEMVYPHVDGLILASAILHAAFYFYTAYALIRYMFADSWVTTDELLATGACFTVVVWGFAYVYSAVQIIWPGQFAAPHGGDLRWMELLFLSFTTMTGTGLSDIAPAGAHARSFIMLEQLAGVNYIALVVARLLGLTLVKFRR